MVVQCEQGKEKVGLGRPIMLALSRRLATVVAWEPVNVSVKSSFQTLASESVGGGGGRGGGGCRYL